MGQTKKALATHNVLLGVAIAVVGAIVVIYVLNVRHERELKAEPIKLEGPSKNRMSKDDYFTATRNYIDNNGGGRVGWEFENVVIDADRSCDSLRAAFRAGEVLEPPDSTRVTCRNDGDIEWVYEHRAR